MVLYLVEKQTGKGVNMQTITQNEIRIIYHLMDCIGPDLEKNDYDRVELKPENEREYTNKISFSEGEYEVFKQLKQKLSAGLLGF